MRSQGRITSWQDDRGFGFITPSDGGSRVFVHASALLNRSRRPSGNDVVTYEVTTDAQGRPQAQRVSFAGDRNAVMHALFIAAAFLALVAGLAVAGSLPLAVPGLYLLASAAAFVAYAWDKSAAQRGAWRTHESTLHVLGLCGGWPGALVARHVFRHKSKKSSFIAAFWITVVLNCAAIVWLLTPPGQRLLASLLDW